MVQKAIVLSGLLVTLALMTGCIGPPRMKPYIETFPPPPPQASKEDLLPGALDLLNVVGAGATIERPVYHVGPLDRLSVRVWGRPELGSQVPVNGELRVTVVAQDGTIRLPFLGELHVAGKTVAEINDLVTAAYVQVVESPQVETYLESCVSQTVTVSGDVRQPGPQHLCDSLLTVGERLHTAGGTAPDGDDTHGVLSRDGVRFRLNLRSADRGESRAANIVLHDGDIVHVPATQERLVYIFGEVSRPGTYPIPAKGLTLVETLGLAGGYNPTTARIKELYLARINSGTPVIYRMTISELLTSQDVSLAPGDRILLTPRLITRWNRWVRQLLPSGVNPERAATGGTPF